MGEVKRDALAVWYEANPEAAAHVERTRNPRPGTVVRRREGQNPELIEYERDPVVPAVEYYSDPRQSGHVRVCGVERLVWEKTDKRTGKATTWVQLRVSDPRGRVVRVSDPFGSW